jgi:MFS family permease
VSNTTLGSTLTSQGNSYLSDYFHIENKLQLALPVSLFLVGYVIGPTFFGPLSELYGRRIVLLPSYAIFTAANLGCAVAPNWGALLAFRLVVGICASAPFTLGGAVFADLWSDPIPRGKAIMAFIVVSTGTFCIRAFAYR